MEELLRQGQWWWLLVPVAAVIVGAIMNSVLAHWTGKANRTATQEIESAAWRRAQDAESAAWRRAQESEHAGWLREERTKVHFQFIEKVAETKVVAVSNPNPGPVDEWDRDYRDRATSAVAEATRVLDRMKLLCEFPTYKAACDWYFRSQEHIGFAAVVPPGAPEYVEYEERLEQRTLRLGKFEKKYMDAVRQELGVVLEDSRASVYD
jgi:hypothetical protein